MRNCSDLRLYLFPCSGRFPPSVNGSGASNLSIVPYLFSRLYYCVNTFRFNVFFPNFVVAYSVFFFLARGTVFTISKIITTLLDCWRFTGTPTQNGVVTVGNNETTLKQRPDFLLGEFTKARQSQINETSRRGVVLLILSFTTPLCVGVPVKRQQPISVIVEMTEGASHFAKTSVTPADWTCFQSFSLKLKAQCGQTLTEQP
ncbi:hypothetical protein LSAT2_030271 [Lamellibrachia satsuma]|nr:hypothetical protein LSAT2_030271 [Lamellibrachia satsuma]